MGTSNPLKKLRAYTRGPRKIADMWAIESELAYGTSDRAMAVLMGAMVEDALESWLRFNMSESLTPDDENRLTGPQGVIGTFSSKIILGFAFNLFGPTTRHDLDLIRNIRNEFAHSRRPLDFKLREVEDVCAQLTFCDLDGVETPSSFFQAVLAQNFIRPRNWLADEGHG
jgi:hypothetical protein